MHEVRVQQANNPSQPCPCSCEEPVTVWEGAWPQEYRGALGAIVEEDCHGAVLFMEQKIRGSWIRVRPELYRGTWLMTACPECGDARCSCHQIGCCGGDDPYCPACGGY